MGISVDTALELLTAAFYAGIVYEKYFAEKDRKYECDKHKTKTGFKKLPPVKNLRVPGA